MSVVTWENIFLPKNDILYFYIYLTQFLPFSSSFYQPIINDYQKKQSLHFKIYISTIFRFTLIERRFETSMQVNLRKWIPLSQCL